MSIENKGYEPSLELSDDQWFEQQFAKRETMEVSEGQTVEVLDISPRELKHETPILFISGYGDGSPEGRKANVLEILKQGRRALVIKSPHGVDHNLTDDETAGLQESLLRQTAAIGPVLEKKGIEKISAIGESRGGAVVIMAAAQHPEKFENISLTDPVGMVGEMGAAKLIMRFIHAGIVEGKVFNQRLKAGEVSSMAKEQVVSGTKKFWGWVLENPKASASEVVDMAKAEVYQLLKELKKQGIGITIIHGVDDKVFPMADVQERLGKEIRNEEGVENVIDGFYSVQGGHGAMNTNPELYTRVAEKSITALEAKQKKHSI